ncbi:MAG: glycosyl transferase family 1, partial [Methylocystis sp.]
MVLGLTRKINASIATIASKLAHSDFDPAFYRSYYSDLRHLRADEDLYAHFYWHGRKENRYKNAQDALNKLQLRFGNLPPDFNVHMYAALNRDLAGSYNNDLSLIAHFLQYGRIEGRPYTSDSISLFPWTDLFDTAAFVAYSYGWLKEVPKSKREAVEIFANEGIPRLAPLNLDLIFDPVYYRSIYEIPDDKSDEDMYADWLQQGLLEGKHPNEEDALKRLTSTWTYPASFDWEKYKSQLRSSEAIKLRDRVSVLRHLFEHGFEEGLAATTVGSGASELFRAIGDYHLVRKNFVVAHAAFDQAIQAGDDDHGHTFHRRGDTLMALERPSEALSDFKRAAESPYASVWSHINAASAAIKCGDFAEASTILRAARPRWEKHIRHREFVTSFINDVFADGTRAARELYKADDRGAADAKMREMLQECEKLILDLESLPVKAAIPSAGHISILANLDLAQCKYYRVDQKIRQLEAAGFEVKHFSHSDPGAFISSLVGAKAAIFYRVHAFPDIIRSILTANALGLPTYYDVDDLIFDSEHFPDTLESYEGQITRDDYNGLMYGVPLIRYAMSLCQFGIASTTPLARHISKVVRSGQCDVMRNGFDERNDRSLLVGASPRPDRGVVSIFYGSGTKAHNSDFNELASSALASVLEKYRHVRLVIVGHLR